MSGYSTVSTFRRPDGPDYEIVLKAEGKVLGVRILGSVIILAIYFSVLFFVFAGTGAGGSEDSPGQTSDGASTGFYQTEESIIKELYGNAEEYAESRLYNNKKNFLDKATTAATGTMTYDEAAMEAYRQEMIAEFNAKIDHNRVAAILEERRAAYTAGSLEQGAGAEGSKGRPIMNIIMYALAALLAVIYYFIVIKRYLLVKKGAYELVEGTVTDKAYLLRRDLIIGLKRRATVSYKTGVEEVTMTYPQGFSIAEGEKVYLVRLNGRIRRYLVCRI